MTKEEAIQNAVKFAEGYIDQDHLNDAQAARIGRNLYANLRQARRDNGTENKDDA